MIVASVLMVVGVAGAAETPEPPTVGLRVINGARVPDDVLEEGLQEVARIFARAGFEVTWTGPGPKFTVNIVAGVLGYDRAKSNVMGAASRTAHGPIAQVFFRQVEDFARIYRVDVSTMLGHVIAHEVGHLLLPRDSHSRTGLMRGVWDDIQIRDAAGGRLTFTDTQAQKIRVAR
jgi:hypothetical protein